MTRMNLAPRLAPILFIASVFGHPGAAFAQTFDAVGTRAAGMGGAHVAAVDDASATYWNPGGLASAAYFSLVVDWSHTTVDPGGSGAHQQSALLFALGMPAFGLSYYRLEATALRVATAASSELDRNVTVAGSVRVETLSTQHLGATFVQSVLPGIAVGATLKMVRGRAGGDYLGDGDRKALLDDGALLPEKADRAFDADLGVMAAAGKMKAGFTVRNLTEPEFQTADGARLRLQRQARAGLAIKPGDRLTIAADVDLLKTTGRLSEARDLAGGGEARLGSRAYLRSGFRLNMIALPDGGHTPSAALGGSIALTRSLLLDGQVTSASDGGPKGWGVSARFVY